MMKLLLVVASVAVLASAGQQRFAMAKVNAVRLSAASQSPSVGMVEVAWDANPVEDHVDGYLVEYGPRGGAMKVVDVGNALDFVTQPIPVSQTVDFRVYAYRGELRSDPSETVSANPVPPFTCAPFAVPGASPVVSIVVQDFDRSVARNNPKGALVRFDAGSSDPIARIELDLDGDGEPGVPAIFPVGVGFDGRYIRALAFKPTINGTWPLIVTATDTAGRTNATRCTPGLTVTMGGTQ